MPSPTIARGLSGHFDCSVDMIAVFHTTSSKYSRDETSGEVGKDEWKCVKLLVTVVEIGKRGNTEGGAASGRVEMEAAAMDAGTSEGGEGGMGVTSEVGERNVDGAKKLQLVPSDI